MGPHERVKDNQQCAAGVRQLESEVYTQWARTYTQQHHPVPHVSKNFDQPPEAHRKSTNIANSIAQPGKHHKAHNDVNHTTRFLRGSTSTQSTTFHKLTAFFHLGPPHGSSTYWLCRANGGGVAKAQRRQGLRGMHSSRKPGLTWGFKASIALHTDDWAHPHVKLPFFFFFLIPTGY